MIACVDGIAGVGKSTLLRRLQRHATDLGIKTNHYHFFSDIRQYAPGYEGDTREIEEVILQGNIDYERRTVLFRKLCEIGCAAFLSIHQELDSGLTFFDRSPLSWYAYSEAIMNERMYAWPEFVRAVDILQPFVLRESITETHRRMLLRDGGIGKGFFQRLSIEQDERAQDTFVRLAHHFGIRSGDPDTAWECLTSHLFGENTGIRHADDIQQR
jgi:thymidylate kinase